jgi:hypothetical protein
MDEYITFYREWLSLDKRDFRILTMLADIGSFRGNLTALCQYLSLSPGQKKTNAALRQSIETLTSNGYITSALTGRTYQLAIIPKEQPIEVARRWFDNVMKADRFSETVSWEMVVKTLVWISGNSLSNLVVNDTIAAELNTSVGTLGVAKNVLEKDFHSIIREVEKYTLPNGEKRNRGQRLAVYADWSG